MDVFFCIVASITIKNHFIFFLVVNLTTFVMMRNDKNYARMRQWRIPEFKFMIGVVFGGFLGVHIGSTEFRHKTQKTSFWRYVGLSFITWVTLCLTTLYHSCEICEKELNHSVSYV